MDVLRQCKICNSTFYARLCRVKQNRALYCSNYCRGIAQHLKPSKANGYVKIYAPWHCHADCHGRVYEHVLVAVSVLGRPLKHNEVVHHINGLKADNRKKNLLICTKSYHGTLHSRDHKRGEEHPNAMLTNKQVREIKISQLSRYALMERFNVSYNVIGGIQRGESWCHL